MGLKCNHMYLFKRGRSSETDTQRRQHEDRAGRDEAISQGKLTTTRSWKGKKGTLPQGLQNGLNTLIADFWPPELRENKFLLFEATRFVVIAATRNQDTGEIKF